MNEFELLQRETISFNGSKCRNWMKEKHDNPVDSGVYSLSFERSSNFMGMHNIKPMTQEFLKYASMPFNAFLRLI